MKTIYKIRRRLIMSQQELADLLGKSRSTIQRWEADDVRLNESAVLDLWAAKWRPTKPKEGEPVC